MIHNNFDFYISPGIVPEIICGIDNIYLDNNNLCSPYPECLSEEDIGYQDTSNCP